MRPIGILDLYDIRSLGLSICVELIFVLSLSLSFDLVVVAQDISLAVLNTKLEQAIRASSAAQVLINPLITTGIDPAQSALSLTTVKSTLSLGHCNRNSQQRISLSLSL